MHASLSHNIQEHVQDVAVVGAGISGLSAARLLKESGHNVTIFEREDSPGGLVRCTYENDALFHRVGGHVFNSKNQKVLDWFWKHFDIDVEFTKAIRNASIYLGGKFVPYPIELNLKHLSESTGKQVISELVDLANTGNQSTAPHNTGSLNDFFARNFGKTLCDLYFFDYNKKIWRTDLESISMSWLRGKLPMASPMEIIQANIIKTDDKMVHSQFYYPRCGGSQFIIDRLAENLEIVRANIHTIQRTKDGIKLNNDDSKQFSCVVYTGDLRNIGSTLSNDSSHSSERLSQLLRSSLSLRSHGTTTLLCECDKNPYSWVYLPGQDLPPHRIIMTGNLAVSNSPARISKHRTTCTVEYSGHATMSEMEEYIQALPFSMKPLAYNYCKASYILHDDKSCRVASELTALLARLNIYCLGRFGEWQYYNMDAAIESAFDVVDKINGLTNVNR
jgi:protoporphyrinogen oxidase